VLDWIHPVEAAEGQHGRVWIAGLSTVWVSDKNDAERKLVIGGHQLNLLAGVEPNDLVLLLTHHPPGWLHHDAEDLLANRLSERSAHIHFCGHVHSESARVLRGLGAFTESVRLVAGAAHGDPVERHGYSWGAIRWNALNERWELGWSPRVFISGRGVRPDTFRYQLGDDEFAWEPLRLAWKAP
jgi:hypothetical protein